MGVTINEDISDELCSIEGDPNAIQSLIVNLLENSLDACRFDNEDKSHEVKLSAYEEGNDLILKVADNGIGMEKETQNKAFSMFFSSKGSEGTGLGLFVANKIAVSHKGKISINSTPGKGTEFTITLPKTSPSKNKE